jgi:metallo-beta-lactamase family protein
MSYFKPETEREMKREESIFEFPFLTHTPSHEDSESIEKTPGPKIIIAGAGMSHGGRIGGWETRYLPDASTTLFIVGYQAPGSPGRRIAEGAGSVRIADNEVKIRAKVETLDGWSAHADRDELLKFAESCLPRPKVIFTAMGEPSAERFLAQRIHDYLGVRAAVANFSETWEITKEFAKRI